MSSNNSSPNQYDYQKQQAKANAASARRQGGITLDTGAMQLADYTDQLERGAGQMVSSMGQSGMFTFGGPGGSRANQFRDPSEFGTAMAETDPWQVAADVTKEQGQEWKSLGNDLSDAEDELSKIQRSITMLQYQKHQASTSSGGSSSSRDVSVRESEPDRDPAVPQAPRVQGNNESGDSDSSSSDRPGRRQSDRGGSSSGGWSARQQERLEELQERAEPIKEQISQIKSQRGDISSNYDGEGDFSDALGRASRMESRWQEALGDAGDTDFSMPQQLKQATGSNLLNISSARAEMKQGRSRIINKALTAADSAFFDAQQQNDSANYLGQLADAQREAQQAQNVLGGIAGAAQLVGGTILTFGVPGAQAAGIGMMASGAGTVGSSFL